MAEAPCGCHVDETVHADTNTERGQIMFCPKHAEVDNLVAALKQIDAKLREAGWSAAFSPREIARDAIEAAEKPAARGGAS